MKKPRILIVDDSAYFRKMLVDALSKTGFQIVGEAINGEQAIDLYAQLKPDIVTMDIIMPKMDGIQAIQEIMKRDSKAAILVITALNQEPKIRHAINYGALKFLIKPVKPEEVIYAINSILDGL